jgi:hypothetical protein
MIKTSLFADQEREAKLAAMRRIPYLIDSLRELNMCYIRLIHRHSPLSWHSGLSFGSTTVGPICTMTLQG